MAVVTMDLCGLKCPQPILKIAAKSPEIKPGDVLEATADCATFSKDIRQWCDSAKKTLLFCNDEGGGKFRVQIQF